MIAIAFDFSVRAKLSATELVSESLQSGNHGRIVHKRSMALARSHFELGFVVFFDAVSRGSLSIGLKDQCSS